MSDMLWFWIHIEASDSPDISHYISKVYLTYMIIYLQLSKHDECIQYGKKALSLSIKELDLRFSNNQMYTKNKAKKYKQNRLVETIVLVFINLALAYEFT